MSQEHSRLQEIVSQYRQHKKVQNQIDSNKELLEGGDSEIAEMAREELKELEAETKNLLEEKKAQLKLIGGMLLHGNTATPMHIKRMIALSEALAKQKEQEDSLDSTENKEASREPTSATFNTPSDITKEKEEQIKERMQVI